MQILKSDGVRLVNEADTLAILIGIKWTKAMGICNLIDEGGSKCTLSWGGDAPKTPWNLANEVEEKQDLRSP